MGARVKIASVQEPFFYFPQSCPLSPKHIQKVALIQMLGRFKNLGRGVRLDFVGVTQQRRYRRILNRNRLERQSYLRLLRPHDKTKARDGNGYFPIIIHDKDAPRPTTVLTATVSSAIVDMIGFMADPRWTNKQSLCDDLFLTGHSLILLGLVAKPIAVSPEVIVPDASFWVFPRPDGRKAW